MKEYNYDNIFVFCSEISHKSEETKDGKKYFVEGYLSTSDLDLVNDIVTPNCLKDMLEQMSERIIKLDFEHEAFRGKSFTETQINKTRLPLGKAVDRTNDEKGLKVKWELNSNWKKFDDKGNIVMTFNEVWASIKNGFYDAFSIAYIPISTAEKQLKDGKTARMLDQVSLLNAALTGNPVNTTAKMTIAFAKSLEYLNDQEKLKKGDDTMTEEKDKPKDDANPAVKDDVPADDAPADSPKEDEAEKKDVENKDLTEVKSKLEEVEKDILEVKSVLEKKDKEIEELKSKLAKPIHKTVQEGKEAQTKSVPEVSPLDIC